MQEFEILLKRLVSLFSWSDIDVFVTLSAMSIKTRGVSNAAFLDPTLIDMPRLLMLVKSILSNKYPSNALPGRKILM